MRLLNFFTLRFLFALLPLMTACESVQHQQRLASLPQDSLVQVYFNHTESAEYREPYRQQKRRGDDLEQKIVDAIAQADSAIDVAVQELRLPKIAQALVERQKAGVKVRVILDNTYSSPWSKFTATEVANLPPRERDRYHEFRQLVDRNHDNQLSPAEINQGDALVVLTLGKVPWIDDTADDSAGSSLMHHKFVIIDSRTLIVTSANFTTSDIHGDFSNPNSLGNANNLLKIDSPKLAALFTQEFNLMWGDGPGFLPNSKFGLKKPFRPDTQVQLESTNIKVQFSPTSPTLPWKQSSNGLISKTLNSAINSVDLALFVFSDQGIANNLETDHQQGVQVRALIEPSFAYRPYSEGLDMMGVSLGNNCKYEADNHPWQQAIATVGVPQLLKGDLLHHKFGVIDQQMVITGSHNWSEAANSGNDETVLVIQNATVAAHYRREFERLYANARLGLPDNLQKKIQLQKQCLQLPITSRPVIASSNRNSVVPIPNESKYQVSQKVNLNTASLEELEALPGVGAKLAQRIITARQQKMFTSLEDLDEVSGVGPSLLKKLSDRVTW